MHLSVKKCHDQKQRGLRRLETKCSDGTDPLVPYCLLCIGCVQCKKMIPVSRQTTNDPWLELPWNDALLPKQLKTFLKNKCVCSFLSWGFLGIRGGAMERHRKHLLQGGLENLSERDVSNNRPGRLLNKLLCFFSAFLGQIHWHSKASCLFPLCWEAEHHVCPFASWEAPGSHGIRQGDRGRKTFWLQSRGGIPLSSTIPGPLQIEV